MRRICPVFLFLSAVSIATASADEPWARHTIDNSSRGADGVRLADVNQDGWLDIATGWEEGGVIRAYLNPGPKNATDAWPAVTVGKVKSPEDAVFADLDGDGAVDVVSSCEGRTKTMFFHWAPKDPKQYLDASAWKTDAVPVTMDAQLWMFALPLDVDGRNGVDLIVGSKGAGACIGWLESPENPRDVTAWKFHRLRDAGWIMSLEKFDMDGDGDFDVVATDRKGDRRGLLWLENPGAEASRADAKWTDHSLGGSGREVMFLDIATANDGVLDEILVAVKPVEILRIRRGEGPTPWITAEETLPAAQLGTAKSVRKADLNLDGIPDFVFSCEQANGAKTGLVWLQGTTEGDPKWKLRQLGGSTGVKYDLIQLADLDADGDLDVICCEERANLGVFWYENPSK
ncbi:MAG: VCBS repeat-containing protein [Planctomycetota bacterium]|nr:VCBS repeat-containing protein [Planctomycetota bacterium]MDA1250386.1 VCBS repeat-containing protein [Planctomycetota bacterium]